MFVYPNDVTLYKKVRDPNNPDKYLKDDYARFILEETPIKVALSLETRITRDRDGNEITTIADIDIPANISISYGDEIEYTDPNGDTYRGEIVTVGENRDPLGIKILSRYVTIG